VLLAYCQWPYFSSCVHESYHRIYINAVVRILSRCHQFSYDGMLLNWEVCGAIHNQTSPNFFAQSLMILRIFVLNVFCAVDKVSLFMINCMRFVFVLISVTSMKDIFDTIFTVKDAESNGISRQRL
jgi:small-conductance mechanosensitive channel